MKKLHGLPLQLVSYLKHQSWMSKGTLTMDMEWRHQKGKSAGKRYLPETVGRALRSLEEQKIVAVRDSGISVEYKYLPSELRERYIPSSARPDSDRQKLFRERSSEVQETEIEMMGAPSLPYRG